MIRDGTQERQIDPSEQEPTYTERELRAMEDAARRGFDAPDELAKRWLDHELADIPYAIARVVRCAIEIRIGSQESVAAAFRELADAVDEMREVYACECLFDYAGDI